MKELNKKREHSTTKKSSSKTKMNKSFHKSTKCLKIQSFKFIEFEDNALPKTTKELTKSTKKIKSMKRIIWTENNMILFIIIIYFVSYQ